MNIGPAQESELAEIFANVHEVWPHHTELEQHIRLRLDSPQHKHANWFVVRDESGIAASLGAYSYPFQLSNQAHKGIAIGAVHCKAHARGKGYASQLIKHVNDFYQQHNYGVSLLFSDISTDFYTKLGYHSLPIYHGIAEAKQNENLLFEPTKLESALEIMVECNQEFANRINFNHGHWEWLKKRHKLSAYTMTGDEICTNFLVGVYESANYILASDFSANESAGDWLQKAETLAFNLNIKQFKYWYPDSTSSKANKSMTKPKTGIPMIKWLNTNLENPDDWLIQAIHHV